MSADARHERILDVVRRRGYASIDELVSQLAVTPQTVRRDLQELSGRGFLRRHHGGASIPSSTVNLDYAQRHVEQAREKERIASAAASLVTSGSSVFMTPGTTIEAAAAVIARSDLKNIRVVTNSIAAAQILGKNSGITVCVTGGFWQATNHGLAGPVAAQAAERYHCDIMLTSIGAISREGWLLEFRDEDVVVAKTMLENARRRILLADHTKFARTASCKLARISEMTTLVTDMLPPKAFGRIIKDSGCELLIAPDRRPRR